MIDPTLFGLSSDTEVKFFTPEEVQGIPGLKAGYNAIHRIGESRVRYELLKAGKTPVVRTPSVMEQDVILGDTPSVDTEEVLDFGDDLPPVTSDTTDVADTTEQPQEGVDTPIVNETSVVEEPTPELPVDDLPPVTSDDPVVEGSTPEQPVEAVKKPRKKKSANGESENI